MKQWIYLTLCIRKIGYHAENMIGSRVFVKKLEISKGRIIQNEDEIEKHMCEAATIKPKQRLILQRNTHDSEENVEEAAF